jgi:hypothetical protein
MENLQSVGKEFQEARQKYLLKDDQDEMWQALTSMQDQRVDIVLDNGKLAICICNRPVMPT